MAKKNRFVVDGAKISCSMGDKSASLNVTTDMTTRNKGKKIATAYDCTNLNMFPQVATFGTCKPYKTTPVPICTFIPTGPWKIPYNKTVIEGKKVLLGKSFLICPRAAGKITIGDPKQAEQTDLEEPLKCPGIQGGASCGGHLGDAKHKTLSLGHGVYEGNGDDLGWHILQEVYKKDHYYEHPFFYTDGLEKNDPKEIAKVKKSKNRSGIQAHHLITSATVRNEKMYREIIYTLGYSINHHKNGVLLPSVMKVACSYNVPLHKGGHDIAFVLNDFGESKLVASVFDPTQELTTINYAEKVKETVIDIMKSVKLTDICDVEKRKKQALSFINRMDKFSQEIFVKIRTFQWTLTADGFDYQHGGIGCYNCIDLPEKRQKIIENFNLDLKGSVQDIQAAIYNDKEKLKEIYKTGRCTHKKYINPLKAEPDFKERSGQYIKKLEKID